MTGAALALASALQLAMIDWAAMPALPSRAPPVITPAMNTFVAREARARRCKVQANQRRAALTVEVAMLVAPSGEVRTAIPRAIGCATVEQYAAGLATAFARGNLLPGTGEGALWYKTSLTFSWQQ